VTTLALGTWQGLYLCEWGTEVREREVVATLLSVADHKVGGCTS
jgi:thiamine phosphate synthase YjbQ (UPF0047 family)